MINFELCCCCATSPPTTPPYKNTTLNSKLLSNKTFFETLNPLKGFKDTEDFETYLFEKSNEIEPKDGDIKFVKPTRPSEALRSPGVKLPTAPKTPTGTFQRNNIASTNNNKNHQTQTQLSTTSASPIIQQKNSSHSFTTNNSQSLNYSTNFQQQDDSNFAIVDIVPRQHPRWMGDQKSMQHHQIGSINEAFTSEYIPTSPLMASIMLHQQNKSPHHNSPLSPPPSATSISLTRRPPAPLSSTETRFAFPPSNSSNNNSPLIPTKKAPLPQPLFILGSATINNSNSGFVNQQNLTTTTLSDSFPLAKPPIGQRRKQPAPDPITTTTSTTTLLNQPDIIQPLPKSPTVSLMVPLPSNHSQSPLSSSSSSTTTTILSTPTTQTTTITTPSTPPLSAISGSLSQKEPLITPPPQLPPRVKTSPIINNNSEAMAPPRPPKKTTSASSPRSFNSTIVEGSDIDRNTLKPPLPPKPAAMKPTTFF